MPPRRRHIAFLLFGSGFSALVYEASWQRMLRLIFGASTAASSAVLGIFLGGLGLGGFLVGRRAERHPKPLFLYGQLELGAALSAALTPFWIDAAAWVYFHAGGSRLLGVAGATCLRLLLTAVILGPTVVLMGGSLPAAARAVETDDDAGRRHLAGLYAVNTLGAVVGVLLSTFLLFEVFGTRISLWIACIVNVLVAILARALGREAPPIAGEGEPLAPSPAASTEASLPPWLVYAMALVVGFSFLCLELIWYRMLAPLLGGSSFTFGLILAVALLGIGIGGYGYALRGGSSPALPSWLALTIGIEALTVAYPLALGDNVAIAAACLRNLSGLGFGALVIGWAVMAALVVLPTAIVSGYQFPLLFALLGRGQRGVARQVGTAYAFNTMGSILGAVLAGFVLLPRLGAVFSWRLVVWILAVSVALTLAVAWRRTPRRSLGASIGAVLVASLAVFLTGAEGPTAAWRHSAIGAGRAGLVSMTRNELRLWSENLRHSVSWERDGVESTLGLDHDTAYAFVVNGKTDGNVMADRGTQVMASLLPMLLHDHPRTVFVLGLGTGMSAGWAGAVPAVERVDVAEIEPAMSEVARLSSPANQHVLDNPKVHLFQGDGREFLLTTDQQYDVILSEPSNPFRAGIASLFTAQFYQSVDKHLAPGGIFAQWLQGYEIDAYTVRLALATLQSVFPQVEAWQTQAGDLLLLGARERIVYDVTALRRKVREEPYRSALLRAWLVEDVEGVLSHFLASPDVVRQLVLAHQGDVNTDDVNLLEYAFARSVGRQSFDPALELIQMASHHPGEHPVMDPSIDWGRVEEQRIRAWLALAGDLPVLPIGDKDAAARAQAVAAGCMGDLDQALRSWNAQPEREPRDLVETFAVAQALAQGRQESSLKLASDLAAQGFQAESELVQLIYLARTGRREEAVSTALRALESLRTVALPLCSTAERTIEALESCAKGDPAQTRRAVDGLLSMPLAVSLADRGRILAAQRLAFSLGDPALCLKALGDEVDRPRWLQPVLLHRHQCLEAVGDSRAPAALRDLQTFLDATPGALADGLSTDNLIH